MANVGLCAPALLAGLAMASFQAQPPRNGDLTRDVRSTDLPRPRDGNVAVREELDAARRAGTVAAYDLFLARHGGHPLAAEARRARAQMARAPRK